MNQGSRSNKTNDSVYGATAITIKRVHPVYLLNAAECQVAIDLWTKPVD